MRAGPFALLWLIGTLHKRSPSPRTAQYTQARSAPEKGSLDQQREGRKTSRPLGVHFFSRFASRPPAGQPASTSPLIYSPPRAGLWPGPHLLVPPRSPGGAA
jgi:hypothetical protein